jgi:3-oxoacyl-[acyl-carrier-protein] synthase-3
MDLVINSIGRCVPARRLKLEEIGVEPPLAPGVLGAYRKLYGLEKVAASDSPLGDMMVNAAAGALGRHRVAADAIAVFVHVHTAPQAWTPPFDLLPGVCRRMGLRRAVYFAVHANNCASPLNAIQIGRRLLDEGRGYALIVIADLTFTEILRHIPNTTVCGDAVAACLVSGSGPGALMRSLEIDYCGAHSKGPWQSVEEHARFERAYAPRLAGVMRRAIERAGIDRSDLRWIFPHNVNLVSWRDVAARLNLGMDQVYTGSLSQLGHCFGADPFLNWSFEIDRLRAGDHIMVATVGLGAVFGAAVFRVLGGGGMSKQPGRAARTPLGGH